MKYYFYIARCSDGSLYIGQTTDLIAREKRHNNGTGADYTKMRRPIEIIYSEEFASLSDARRREIQVKKWSRIKKENLVKYGHPTKF